MIYDLAVVGAGPVGCLTALLAQQRGLSVLLLDAAPHRAEQAPAGPVDLRVVALAPGSRGLIESVQAWPADVAQRIQPYSGMQVWDAVGQGRIRFDASDLQRESLGDIVEVGVLQWGLNQALAASRVTRWQAAQVLDLDYVAEGVQLQCGDGRQVTARAAVGADGRDSLLRQRAGIALQQRDYAQQGVVAVLQAAQPHQAVARQAFTDRGPLALLPLPQDQISIVWSLPDAQVQPVLALSDSDFLRALQQASGVELSAVLSRRVSFPLSLQQAEDYAQDQIALAGDAAHVVHPLAGLGMNLGFEDAAALVKQLDSPTRCRSSRALVAALNAYSIQRKREVLPALGLIDGLDRLFGSRSGEVVRLREAGLNLLDQQALIKNQFVRYALGQDFAP